MSHESAPQVTNAELHTAIDQAAGAAREAGGHSHEQYLHGSSEQILSSDYRDNIYAASINRTNDEWYKDRTEVAMNVLKPSAPGEDPYHRAGTRYSVKLKGGISGKTRIERTDNKGNVVYTHESDDLQLARRAGKVAAKVIEKQSAARVERRKAA